MKERANLETAIAALEAQRATLGDAATDLAIAPLRARLADLASSTEYAGHAQRLKPVTVMFIDVVGSTSIASRLDPEDIHRLMDSALRRFTEIVEAHHGRVLQYTGDGLLAAFGAEEAREQDAESAVRAGLQIIDATDSLRRGSADETTAAWPSGFAVRVGLDTGRVLLGGGVDAENTIRGNAVNLAARMEQSAPVGGLRISHNTYLLVRDAFEVVETTELRVKGIESPVRSYVIGGARPPSQRRLGGGIEGIETRLIGREAELQRLRSAYQGSNVEAGRRPGCISVIGDAGLGKSRLLREFEAWLREQAGNPLVLCARALPHSQRQPYALMRELFAGLLAISESDSAEVARHKLVAGLAPLFEEDGPTNVHLLGHLIGIDHSASPYLRGILSDPAQIRARAFHAGGLALRCLLARAPRGGVLLLDDLHWADDDSVDFIQELARTAHEAPLLLVAGARPEWLERRPRGLEVAGAEIAIELALLSAEQSRSLSAGLLSKIADAPPALIELLVTTSDGNPFFMEELVRMLLDEGAIVATPDGRWRVAADRLRTLEVPRTLAGVLQSRLDRLAAAERMALQQASVIGHVFWDQALAAIDPRSPASLGALTERRLVLRHEVSSLRGALEFAFQHHLQRQFTYDSVLKDEKRAYHARAATWLALNVDRSTEHLAAIAAHFDRAGDSGAAAWWYMLAAEAAAARDARDVALDHVDRALTLVGTSGDREVRWRLLLTREKLLAFREDEERHRADLDALDELADAFDDDAHRASATYRRASFRVESGDYVAGEDLSRRALSLATRAGDASLSALSRAKLSAALRREGRFAEAKAIAQEGVAGLADCELRAKIELLMSLEAVLTEEGDLAAGMRARELSLGFAREIDDRFSETLMLNNLGDSLVRLGDYSRAQASFSESLRLARQIGRSDRQAIAQLNLAATALLQGSPEGAIAHAEAAAQQAAAVGARDLEAAAHLPLGLARLALGHLDAAEAALVKSSELFELNAGAHLALEPIAGLAIVHASRGNSAAALHAVQRVLDHLDAGGRLDGTEEPLRIRWSCWRVLEQCGDPRAAGVLDAAHADLQSRAARILDAEMRERFLHAVPHHHAILEARAASSPS